MAKALRAQAAALRVQADAIDAQAEALDEQPVRSSVAAGAEWVPVASCGLPRATVNKLAKKREVRAAIIGREKFVHAADLAAWVANRADRSEPVIVEASSVSMSAYERALKRAS